MAVVATIGALLLSSALSISPAAAATPATVAPNSAVATILPMDPTSGDATEPTVNACGSTNSNAVTYQYPYLPLDRWVSDTNKFHNRYGSNPLSSIAEKVSMQGVTSIMFSIGNAVWGMTSGITNFSIEFCLLDRMGGLADNAAATIGNAILGNALIGVIVVAILVGLLVRAYKTGENPMKALISKAVIVGVMAMMMIGATNSTGGGSPSNPDGPFVPGFGGPGWVAMNINQTVQNISAGPSAAMLGTTGQPTPLTIGKDSLESGEKSTDWMSCDAYVTGLRTAYTSRIGDGSGAMDLSGSTPMILSSMWEQTGLRSWRYAQFGQSSVADGKSLDDKVWCRMLEMNAGIPGMLDINSERTDNGLDGTQRGIARTVPNWQDWSSRNDYAKNRWMSSAVNTSNDEQMDRSMIAWLACDPAENFEHKGGEAGSMNEDWVIRAEFRKGEGGNDSVGDKELTADKCVQWWSAVNDPMNNPGLDWGNGSGEVAERMPNNPATASFLNALHGQNVGGAVVSGMAYIVSALCILFVFGGLSIAVIFSKLGMVIILVIVPFLFVAELLPFGNKQGSKLMDAVKYFLGMSFFAAMSGLVMSLMVVITKLLIDGGVSLTSSGAEIIGLLWSGAAPLLSAILVSMIFKKIFKAPGMFKPSSAAKWAGAAGAIGGGAVGGVVGGGMMKSAMSQGSRRLTDAAMSKVGLGAGKGKGDPKKARVGDNPLGGSESNAATTAKAADDKTLAPGGPREGEMTGVSLSRKEKAVALAGAGADKVDGMGRGIAAGAEAVTGAASDGRERKLAKLNANLGEDEKPMSLSRGQAARASMAGIAGAGFVAAKQYSGSKIGMAQKSIASGARAARENPALLARRMGAGALGASGKVAKTSLKIGAAAIGTAVAPGVAIPLIAGSLVRKNQLKRAANRGPGQLSARQGAYKRYDEEVKTPMLEQLRTKQAAMAGGTGDLDAEKAALLNRNIQRIESGRGTVPMRAGERDVLTTPNDAEAKVLRGAQAHDQEKSEKQAAKQEAYNAPTVARLAGRSAKDADVRPMSPSAAPEQVLPPVAVPAKASRSARRVAPVVEQAPPPVATSERVAVPVAAPELELPPSRPRGE